MYLCVHRTTNILAKAQGNCIIRVASFLYWSFWVNFFLFTNVESTLNGTCPFCTEKASSGVYSRIYLGSKWPSRSNFGPNDEVVNPLHPWKELCEEMFASNIFQFLTEKFYNHVGTGQSNDNLTPFRKEKKWLFVSEFIFQLLQFEEQSSCSLCII